MTYRVGIIGTGHVARLHAEGYRGAGNMDIVAAADVSEEARRAFGGEFRIGRLYADYRPMLAAERLDVVSVCTWPHLHHEMVLAAAETPSVQGILCEKPVALTLDDVGEMVRACDEAGITLAVGHQLRYQRRHTIVRDLLLSGAVGEVRRIWAACGTGDLMSNAIHTADLVLMYLDDAPVADVFGQVHVGDGAFRFGHPVEQCAVGVGCIAPPGQSAPVRFTLESSTPGGTGYHHVVIEGDSGRIEVNAPEGPVLRLWNCGSPSPKPMDVGEEPNPSVGLADDLRRAIREGRDPRSSGRTGYRAVELVLGIFASAHLRAPVSFPLAPELSDAHRRFFAWDGVPKGERGAVITTAGKVSRSRLT